MTNSKFGIAIESADWLSAPVLSHFRNISAAEIPNLASRNTEIIADGLVGSLCCLCVRETVERWERSFLLVKRSRARRTA